MGAKVIVCTVRYRVVGGGVVAAVRPEAGPGRQVLLHAAVHARAEVQLHVEPAGGRLYIETCIITGGYG